jgi:hypothetical protein
VRGNNLFPGVVAATKSVKGERDVFPVFPDAVGVTKSVKGERK